MEAEARQIRELLGRATAVMVVSHKDADGDTLGCALAVGEVLRRMGKTVVVRVPEPVPEVYSFLPGFEEVNPATRADVDLVVVMDSSNRERLDGVADEMPAGVPVINIDHHVSNTRFGDVNLVVPGASSTAEVTFDLLSVLGEDITPSIATNLYCGVMTDTGGFRHDNTGYRPLALAAELASLGANPAHIAAMVYKRHKISGVKLQALTMATIGFECDDRLVHAEVTQAMLRQAGALMEESEGLIDLLNSIEGLQLAILFKELGDGNTKLSIRSREGLDANVLAGVFGGGGHARAAGAELSLPVEAARESVLAEARRMLADHAA